MLQRIARLALAAPRLVVAVAALLALALGVFGLPVAGSLSAGGFGDPTSQSSRANALLVEKFGRGDVEMLILVSATDGIDTAAARSAGKEIVDLLRRSPHVATVLSPWSLPQAAAAELINNDRTAALIIASIVADEAHQQEITKEISDQVVVDRGAVRVQTGGIAMVNVQITEQSEQDLLVMETIAIPLSFFVLVWIFGGLLAAALPLAVGGMAICGALAVLRAITFGTDVSIFALNLSTAMGLALAIDYTLLMISRYRDELAHGAERDEALVRTMVTAGRTVVFSATTVALSMAVMVLFPMYFLKSFAYAGVATVLFAAIAAIVVTPAGLVLLGDRLNSLDVRRLGRRMLGRPEPATTPVEETFWYRWTKFIQRQAIPIGLAGIALLVVLGMPFLGVRWGFPDDRVLPGSASAHLVGDRLRDDFVINSETAVTIVIPDATGLSAGEIEDYAAGLSQVPDVSVVSTPTASFKDGRNVGPPASPAGAAEGSVYLTVDSAAPLFSGRSEAQLVRLHAVPPPAGRSVEFTGTAQVNRDSVDAITSRLPLVLGLIAGIMLVLLFMLTGSVLIPVKALLLNILSLSAAFGAMVWIFQDGNLGALGTTPIGTLVADMPMLLFCIAFGLSMDYEVFLVSRIREFWMASGTPGPTAAERIRTATDNDESVALGIAHTGRVVTAAALLMSISFAALIASNVSFMRMFGLGLTLAVIVDATLVRMILVPAFMHLLNKWNWWAPGWLRRLHERVGIEEHRTVATPEK